MTATDIFYRTNNQRFLNRAIAQRHWTVLWISLCRNWASIFWIINLLRVSQFIVNCCQVSTLKPNLRCQWHFNAHSFLNEKLRCLRYKPHACHMTLIKVIPATRLIRFNHLSTGHPICFWCLVIAIGHSGYVSYPVPIQLCHSVHDMNNCLTSEKHNFSTCAHNAVVYHRIPYFYTQICIAASRNYRKLF